MTIFGEARFFFKWFQTCRDVPMHCVDFIESENQSQLSSFEYITLKPNPPIGYAIKNLDSGAEITRKWAIPAQKKRCIACVDLSQVCLAKIVCISAADRQQHFGIDMVLGQVLGFKTLCPHIVEAISGTGSRRLVCVLIIF